MSRRHRRVHNTLTKASRPAIRPAATFTADQVQALLHAGTATPTTAPLPRAPTGLFGPGVPLYPAPIDPPRDDSSGRPEPRIAEYPVSVNIDLTDRLIPWKVLRDAAEVPIIRDCIRIRKNRIASLEWDITVSKRALQQYRKQDPDTSSVTIARALREKLDPEVGRLVEFWEKPDWEQDESFVQWCGKALEEHHVLDALAIYPYLNLGKDRQGLRIIDGSTVKVLRNTIGGRPLPPYPAYQQILWGFPRGEFIADVDPETGVVINGFPADRLIYKRREVRTITPYGYSGVEQALQDVDLYLRRLEWDKAQFTDGVQPAGWIKNTGLDSWTPLELVEYNRAFNDLYSGRTLDRMRFHLLPPGLEPVATTDIAEKWKPEYHLHLIKIVAMHLDTTIAELGFTEAKGLGTSGYHEGQENVQQRKADNPDLKWLQGVLTEISRSHLGMPRELEFRFLGLDAEDEAAADEVIERQLRAGRITWNEAREEQGRAPYAFAEADKPTVVTTRGLIFVEHASEMVPAGTEVVPPTAVPELTSDQPPDPGDSEASPPEIEDDGTTESSATAEKSAELLAYQKWLRNGHARRAFVFKHVTRDEAASQGIDCQRAEFTAKPENRMQRS